MTDEDTSDRVRRHYGRDGLRDGIRELLARLGNAGEPIAIERLAPLDQFHVRGLEATENLAKRVKPSAGDMVLDVGSGLGGPSRYLTKTYGCKVVGVDLTEEFCRVAEDLAAATGLGDLVEYRVADATQLPFVDEHFDLIWTQHVAMNIADKARLYSEIRRVVRPGGKFVLYDPIGVVGREPSFPVPWAMERSTSFLLSGGALHAEVERAGFDLLSWDDLSSASIAWFEQAVANRPEPGEPSLRLVMGPEFAGMSANLLKNLREGRIRVVEAVFIAR